MKRSNQSQRNDRDKGLLRNPIRSCNDAGRKIKDTDNWVVEMCNSVKDLPTFTTPRKEK